MVFYVIIDEPNVEDQAHSTYATEFSSKIMKRILPFLGIYTEAQPEGSPEPSPEATEKPSGEATPEPSPKATKKPSAAKATPKATSESEG